MAIKFGTSGIRGLVSELTDREVYLFTAAFLKYSDSIGQKGAVAIAADLRESSPHIQKIVCRAIHDHGQKTFLCGKIPTPALAYFAQEKNLLAVMITGSHIPADRNGMKFYLKSGETLKQDDQSIYEIYLGLKEQGYNKNVFSETEALIEEKSDSHLSLDVSKEAADIFTNRYYSFFPGKPLAGSKIIVYQHSSVARDMLSVILQGLGAQVIPLGRSQVFVPVDTEAVESAQVFKSWVHEHQADALVSTDGDGDRPLMVDDKGQVVPGDKIGILTSQFLEIQAVALPISCNSCITDLPEFKEVTLTKIGSPYVVEALNELSKKHSLVAGFEANGGYILRSLLQKDSGEKLNGLATRDSILPIICALVFAKEKDMSLAEMVRSLPPRYTSSILIKNVPVEKSQALLKDISGDPATFVRQLGISSNIDIVGVNNLDGVRLTLNNRDVLHFRPSGNAPEFRCYLESETQESADQLAGLAQKTLEEILRS